MLHQLLRTLSVATIVRASYGRWHDRLDYFASGAREKVLVGRLCTLEKVEESSARSRVRCEMLIDDLL